MIQTVVAKAIEARIDVWNLQYRLINPENGQMLWLEVNAKLIFDPSSQPIHMSDVVQNITKTKHHDEQVLQLNHEIRAQLDEMNALLEILPTGVWIGNGDCSLITGNPAAYRIMGLEPGINASLTNSELEVPAGLRIFVDGVEVQPQDAPMQLVARTAQPLHNFEHESLFADGTRKSIYASIVPILDSRGQVQKVIGAHTDFTERKRMESENALLVALGEQIRQAIHVDEFLNAVCELTAKHFGASRCVFSEVDLANDTSTNRYEYRMEGISSILGAFHLSDYLKEQIDALTRGQSISLDDAVMDPSTVANYKKAHQPEMVHLLERNHNDRFVELMNKFMPRWRTYRAELNRAPLGHADWDY